MNLNLRNLSRAGFRTTSLFTTQTSIGIFYRRRGTNIEFASGYAPNMLGVFRLTKTQYKQFVRGELSLVPPGLCDPTGGKTYHKAEILFEGTVRNLKHLEKIFSAGTVN